MQKESYFSNNPTNDLWDVMWTTRAIEQELDACDIETPPRELFLSFLTKECKILDAGCGLGKWVIYLKRLGYDIVGIDNNELAIDTMKDFDESLQVEYGDILDIQYPDSYFDACISMGVVEHFEDGPVPALKEAYRVLKPDGLVFVSVPTVNIIRRLTRRTIRWGHNTMRFILRRKRGKYYHFLEYRYSKTELESYLKQAGFEVVKTVPHDYYGSKNHAIGLVMDFPFLAARNRGNFRVNFTGKLVSIILDSISPWIACSSILCVGRSTKNDPASL